MPRLLLLATAFASVLLPTSAQAQLTTESLAGLTRDGTFLIENGRISRPVTNFRFNQSMVSLLQNVEMLGMPTRVAAGENSSVSAPIVVPALKVRGFNLASVSDAI